MKVKLTESKLKQIVAESVKKVLNESFYPEDIYGPDVHTWDPGEADHYRKKDYYNMLTTLAQDIENGEYDDVLDDKEWLEDLPEELMGNVSERRMMIDPDYALHNNRDSLEYFQKQQGERPYVHSSNDDERWINKKNSSFNFTPFLKKHGEKLNNVEWDLFMDNYRKGFFDTRLNKKQLYKKWFNGRNPEGEKLHTRGSANRDLMGIDRQRKKKNN